MKIREVRLKYKIPTENLQKISCPEDVYAHLKWMREETREVFVALYLDNKNQILGFYRVGSGTLTEAIVHPRDVFQGAILTNAASVILSHNHPSGILTPSKEDIATSDRLVKAGDILGIPIIDHIIISYSGFLSFKEEHLL